MEATAGPRPRRARPRARARGATPRPRATRSSSARCCATSRSRARSCSATAAGRATARSADVGIPEGIREVVGRRLSRLSDAANRALARRGGDRRARSISRRSKRRAGRPATSCSTRSTRPTQRAIIREGARAPSAATRSRTRSCAPRSTRSSRPTGACACTGGSARRSRRATRAASTSTSTSSRTTSPRARSPAIRSRRSTTAAAPASGPTPSSRSRAAAQHYERALGSLELVDAPDAGVHCDLQIALATALYDAGDERRREAAFSAAASARAADDGVRFARAALVLYEMTGSGGAVDPELVALLRGGARAAGRAGKRPSGPVARGVGHRAPVGSRSGAAHATGERGDRARARSARPGDAGHGAHAELGVAGRLEADGRRARTLARGSRVHWLASRPAGGGGQRVLTTAAYMAAVRGDGAAFAAQLGEAARIRDGCAVPP